MRDPDEQKEDTEFRIKTVLPGCIRWVGAGRYSGGSRQNQHSWLGLVWKGEAADKEREKKKKETRKKYKRNDEVEEKETLKKKALSCVEKKQSKWSNKQSNKRDSDS